MNLKETYNMIAEDWVKDHDQDTWWQEGTERFLSLLPIASTVLDVGCGGGKKISKLRIPTAVFLELPNVKIVEGLGKIV